MSHFLDLLCPPVFLTEFSGEVGEHLGPTLCLSLEVLTRLPSRRRRPIFARARASRRSQPADPRGPALCPHVPSVIPGHGLSVLKGVCIFLLHIQMFLSRDGKGRCCRTRPRLVPRVRTPALNTSSGSLTSVSWDFHHHVCIKFFNGIPCRSGILTKSLAHRRFP